MQNISEKDGIQKQWFKEAKGMTMDTLPGFLKKLTQDYQHDYGTICHAITAGAVATAWAMDRCPNGGITGFQAGCVMWGMIRQWNYSHNKTGLRLIDYDNFLYPQYENEYEKTLSPDTWAAIQKEAKANLKEADYKYEEYLWALEQYQIDIEDFVDRHPDYYERREYYDPLGMGTGEQWDAEEKKKASGFEFAPQEPYEPVRSDGAVYRHWKSIVAGTVPFGYTISDD